jgi:hypothetical protein
MVVLLNGLVAMILTGIMYFKSYRASITSTMSYDFLENKIRPIFDTKEV